MLNIPCCEHSDLFSRVQTIGLCFKLRSQSVRHTFSLKGQFALNGCWHSIAVFYHVGYDGTGANSGQPLSETGKLRLNLITEDLSLVLWYPQQSKHDPDSDDLDGWSMTDNYRPRLSLEAADIMMDYESTDTSSSINMQVYRIEAVEHIPMSSSELTLSGQTLAEVIIYQPLFLLVSLLPSFVCFLLVVSSLTA